MTVMFSGLESPAHWIIVLVIALVVLGPKRLPEVGKSLGSGMRQFKDGLSGAFDQDDEPAAPKPRIERPADED